MAKRSHGKKANKIKDPYAIRRERYAHVIVEKMIHFNVVLTIFVGEDGGTPTPLTF